MSQTQIVSNETFPEFLDRLSTTFEVSLDTETTGLDVWTKDKLCGIGFNLDGLDTYYLPFRHVQEEFPLFENEDVANLDLALLPELFAVLRKVPVLIGHNIKFDLAAMSRDGFSLGPDQRVEDTIVAARLYFAAKHADLSLDACVKEAFGKDAYKDDFWAYMKRAKYATVAQASIERVGQYCGQDAAYGPRLRDYFVTHITATEQDKVWETEVQLMSVLHYMERAGLPFDQDYCEKQIPRLEEAVAKVRDELYAVAGREFDVLSNPELGQVMASLGIAPVAFNKPPKSGAPPTPKWDKDALEKIGHPIGKLVIKYRVPEKLKSTYFEPVREIAKLGHCVIHPNIKSWGTITGRCSCTDPNLQNLSNEDFEFEDAEDAARVKRLYVPRPGFQFWFFDYSQMEMRVFADYMEDENLIKQLEDGTLDYHLLVAGQIWGLDQAEFMRQLAKRINFALIYGVGIKKLAKQMKKSVEQAKQFRAQYFKAMPKAESFMNRVGKTAERRGYVTNKFGRRYDFKHFSMMGHNANLESVATNYLVQGSSADIVKNRMVACHRYLQANGCISRMLLQVHDEIAFEISDDEVEIVPEIKSILEERLIRTYLPVDVAKGNPSWGQKTKIKLAA